jgi:gamma-glutamyl-gamma-aminobutyrate hydrolase PuuD
MKVLLATKDFQSQFREVYPDLEIYPDDSYPNKEVDLLIFTGGEDINPALYREKPRGTNYFNRERDEKETNVWTAYRQKIIKAKKVLGVCRGIQFLNVMMGGNLYQDLYSEGMAHKGTHEVRWIPETTDILNKMTFVNSMHHQAVKKLSSERGYKILATEPTTGVIEAVIWSNAILGVQFHPEFMGDRNKAYFFDAIEQWIKGKPLAHKLEVKEEQPKKYTDYEAKLINTNLFTFMARDSSNE